MRNGLAGYALKSIGLATVVIIFASAITPVQAQGGRGQQPVSRGLSERDRDILNREKQMNAMIKDASRPAPEVQRRLAMTQIADDFKRIQVINNDMMLAVTSNPTLDYKRISDVTGEIRKRALRLKENLILPQTEGAAEPTSKSVALRKSLAMLDELADGAPDSGHMKTSLDTLDTLIMEFVNNPVFKNSGTVVDARMSSKANRDLEDIIELSNSVQKEFRANKQSERQESLNAPAHHASKTKDGHLVKGGRLFGKDGRLEGLEPSTSRTTISRSNQLSYSRRKL